MWQKKIITRKYPNKQKDYYEIEPEEIEEEEEYIEEPNEKEIKNKRIIKNNIIKNIKEIKINNKENEPNDENEVIHKENINMPMFLSLKGVHVLLILIKKW